MRRILILGATGFIGHNLTLEWTKSSDDLVVATGMPCDDFSWMNRLANVCPERLMLDKRDSYVGLLKGVDVVIFLASRLIPGSSNKSISRELDGIQVFAAFLEACVDACVGEVVFMSSGGAVYGKGTPPFDEGHTTNPITTYGIEKLTCEKLLGLFQDQRGLGYRIIRLSNPYGPFQSPFTGQGVIAAFVHKALRGEDLELWGDGSTKRDFIYVEDAARAIFEITHKDSLRNEVVNLGSGCGVSISEVAELVVNTVGTGSRVRRFPARPVDVPENWLDITRYLDACSQTTMTSLEKGIRLTVEWQCENLVNL